MSNRYVFLYAAGMVVIVALVLSSAATLLRPLQERNMRIEKMQNILSTIGIKAPRGEAEELFNEYIKELKVINHKGEETEGDAFEVDLRDENRKNIEDRQLPLFIAQVEDEEFYIVPIRGNGLWGPIWGYVSFYGDLNTIAGANFDHSSETPGLGAEIADAPFENQFKGQKIFSEEGEFVSITVIKGTTPPDDQHRVDGISGGTITSNGVTAMMYNGLKPYLNYFKNRRTS